MDLKDIVTASTEEDAGKEEVLLTSRLYSFGFSADAILGGIHFWLRPRTLFADEKYYFTPYSFEQFCNKVLGYPAKYMSTDLLSRDIISSIAEYRQESMRERKMILKLRRRGERVYLRGTVRPNRTYLMTSSILKALAEVGGGYGLTARGAPSFPDHEFYHLFNLGDSMLLEVGGTQPRRMSLALAIHNSEVGAVKGGLKVHTLLIDEEELASALVIRPNIFKVGAEHLEQGNLERALEEIIDSVERRRDKMVEEYRDAWEEPINDLDAARIEYKLVGLDPPTVEKVIRSCKILLDSDAYTLSKGLLASTLSAYAVLDPRRRELEAVAGRLIWKTQS